MLNRYLKTMFILLCLGFTNLVYSKTLEEYVDQRCKVNCVDTDTLVSATKLVAETLSIDYLILISIIRVESSFNKKARNGSSVGLMQVHLKYHKKKFGNADVYSPYANIFTGASILRDCMDRHRNNLNNSFRCYNGNGNKQYAEKVNKIINEIRKLEITVN